jgi:probable rRNA maturation factor
MASTKVDIRFLPGDIQFTLRHQPAVLKWIQAVAKSHKKRIGFLHYIFVSDDFLLELNRRFLKHDTLTDVITFDFNENEKDKKIKTLISGEIYISIPRVTENAQIYKVSRTEELHRVMAHGLLHLCGFGDKSPLEIKRMRTEEKNALDLRHF